ncbi:MAG: response regulator [Eubacterium sp.]|nr:response regulator [Eubacterium sp.]
MGENTEENLTPEEQITQLKHENKKLRREVKHMMKDNVLLRVANEQASHTQAFIQKDNLKQIFYNHQLLKTSPNVMILTDASLQTVMVSDVFFQYSHWDKRKVEMGVDLRMALTGVLGEDELDGFMKRCQEALDGKDIETYIMSAMLKGKTKDLQTTIRYMKNEDDEIVGLNIVFIDMTEIIDARDKADQANKAKSSFLANMSHEIRTPINAVLGIDEMIIRESNEPEIVSYASDIRSAGRTLLALINEILDFSKVEEGRMEIIPTTYELGSLINDVVNMVNDRVIKKGLKFDIDISSEIPHELHGDEIRIKQCVSNLLINAVKYTEKGSVRLQISHRPVEDNPEEIYLDIRVSDTGIGMKEEDLEKLFAPFTRIEEKRNRKIEGTGLGMSITFELLKLMGSQLSVDSVYGKGSDFSFSLKQRVINFDKLGSFVDKFKKGAVRGGEVSTYHEMFHAPSAKILVIDDMEMNLTVIRGLLKKTEIYVDTVESGREGLAKVANEKYDIIFIDHMMPEMDGIETLEEMRKMPGYEDSVHVALTANAVSGAREKYLDSGFEDYLSKPVDGEILERMIIKYLPEDKIEYLYTRVDDIKPTSDDDDVIPSWMYEIEDLDVALGIKNCGGKQSFMNVIETFHDTADGISQDILKFYGMQDVENYTIKVHGLKSSARIIGDMRLSEIAAALENAGKEKDMDFIDKHTGEAMSLLESISDALKRLDEKNDDMETLSDKGFAEVCNLMRQSAGNMDFTMIESLLDQLKDYKLKSEDDKLIKDINARLMELDWDGIIDLLKDR